MPTTPQPESPYVEHSLHKKTKRVTIEKSPILQKVVSEEMHDHLERAHSTDDAQGASQDRMNIIKAQSKATLDEQSSKGPRCQETMGTDTAFARQKGSVKTPKDSSKVVKTPKGDEGRYDYSELMETLGNLASDLDEQKKKIKNQDEKIEGMKKVILAQQIKIEKLEKKVLKLTNKKKKQRFELKPRAQPQPHDAPKKGESREDRESQVQSVHMQMEVEVEERMDERKMNVIDFDEFDAQFKVKDKKIDYEKFDAQFKGETVAEHPAAETEGAALIISASNANEKEAALTISAAKPKEKKAALTVSTVEPEGDTTAEPERFPTPNVYKP